MTRRYASHQSIMRSLLTTVVYLMVIKPGANRHPCAPYDFTNLRIFKAERVKNEFIGDSICIDYIQKSSKIVHLLNHAAFVGFIVARYEAKNPFNPWTNPFQSIGRHVIPLLKRRLFLNPGDLLPRKLLTFRKQLN